MDYHASVLADGRQNSFSVSHHVLISLSPRAADVASQASFAYTLISSLFASNFTMGPHTLYPWTLRTDT